MEQQLTMLLQPNSLNIEILNELKAYKEYFGELPDKKNNDTISLSIVNKLLEHFNNSIEDDISNLTENDFNNLQIDILTQFPYFLFWKNLKGEYCGCNKNFADAVNLNSHKDIIGKTDFDLFEDILAKKYVEFDNQVLKSNSSIYDIEEKIVDGSKSYLNIWKIPLKNKKNQTIGLLGFCWFRADSQLAMQKLKESDMRFRSYITFSSDVLTEIDKNGFISFISPSIKNVLGYETDELKAKNIEDLIHPDDWKSFYNCLNEKQVLNRIEYRFKNKEGLWRNIESVISPLTSYKKHIVNSRDITSRKQIEKSLLAHKEQLEIKVRERTTELKTANQMLQQFTNQATSNLKEPLRMLEQYLTLFEEKVKDKIDPKEFELLQFVVNSSDQLNLMLEGIRRYAKLKNIDEQKQMVDLNEIIDLVQKYHGYVIHETNAVIHCDRLPAIYAFQSQMMQLFQNLVHNALKFKKDDKIPKIEISCEKRANDYLFKIKDNGIGVHPENSEKIFENFIILNDFQKYRGSGLGLTICKEIVENHNGKIWCESTLGRGACYYFTLERQP